MTALAKTLFAIAACVPALAWADDCAPAAKTQITLTQEGATAVARYDLGEAITCLRLHDRGDVRKLTWKLETPGARLSDDGDTLHFAAPRTAFTVRLKAFERDGQIDRVYSPLIAFGDGKAVAVHTNYLLPAQMARGVSLQFNGFAPTAPANNVGPQSLGPSRTYMVIGQPAVERRGKIALVIDTAMPAWMQGIVRHNITLGERALRAMKSDPAPLSYLITYTEPQRPGFHWRGDTLDTLVRLNFMGAQAGVEDPQKNALIAEFVLHELAHTVTSPALDPTLPGALTLSEGAAEGAAFFLNHQLGNTNADALNASIDGALLQCRDQAGTTLAEKENRSKRQAPYVCGAALQFILGKASASKTPYPLAAWKALLSSAGTHDRGWPGLLQAAGATPQANKAALATLDDITASRIGWDAGMQKLVADGLLRQRSGAELSQPQFSALFAGATIFPVLKLHCKQRYGYAPTPPVFELDAPAGTCGVVPDKFRLVALNGLRLGDNAFKAHVETVRRCTAGLPVELEDDQGRKVMIPCATALSEMPVYTLQ